MQKRATNGTTVDGLVIHLLHRVSQRADEMFAKEIKETDLTPRRFVVLLAVAHSEDPSQTDLVKATGIDRTTIAHIVSRMVGKGLLQRRRQDARTYAVRLTAAGRHALKSAEPTAVGAGAAILARLNAEQRRAFVEALKVVCSS